MPGRVDVVGYAKAFLEDEVYSAKIYRLLANMYRDAPIRDRLIQMAEMEERHAEFWRAFLKERGVEPRIGRVGLKARLSALLFRLLGLGLTLKLLERGERGAIEMYSEMLESPELSEEEKEEVRRILEEELIHEQEFEEESGRFKEFMEHVRDAVLGMSDGLVEILSVSAGLAGAYGDPLYVALGGAIVGIGGALSMGISSFTSVRAQREVRLSVLNRIRLMSRHVAGVLKQRIASSLARKGFSRETAEAVAEEAARNQDLMTMLVAEEEHGLREEALENPVKAGLYTGLFYLLGAMVPLLPYFMGLPIRVATPLSFLFAAAMISGTGFIIAVSAELSIKKKMAELTIAGLGAAVLTFLFGRVASALLGIEVE